MYIGEFIHNHQRWELQLKGKSYKVIEHITYVYLGSGKTPYSRGGDGYAVYRSSIREFLCSEAMHNLGIPTSRALTLIRTKREVYREKIEPGAIVCRAAPSWVRFGSFEIHYYRREWPILRALADYVIRYHYPELLDQNEPSNYNIYARFFREVTRRTANMIAAWQAIGKSISTIKTEYIYAYIYP
jgi:uncharacterized protein YdiU (UPF0061 family)